MTQKYKKICWRAKTANPFCSFYLKHADESTKIGQWYIFWIGYTKKEITPFSQTIALLDESWTTNESL